MSGLKSHVKKVENPPKIILFSSLSLEVLEGGGWTSCTLYSQDNNHEKLKFMLSREYFRPYIPGWTSAPLFSHSSKNRTQDSPTNSCVAGV